MGKDSIFNWVHFPEVISPPPTGGLESNGLLGKGRYLRSPGIPAEVTEQGPGRGRS